MKLLQKIIIWYVRHKTYIDLVKDIVFFIGAIATFVGFYQFLKFLVQRKTLNKKQELENDKRLYEAINGRLKQYVDSYSASSGSLRDIGIRLLYIKNYPYSLEDDGYPQMLYYYFLSDHHQANGYISTKGLYVVEHLWFLSTSIYYNPKNHKWFVDKMGLTFKNFNELKYKHLVKRIPFNNIYGYDFDSDWAGKGEPVFYTRYKYFNFKLYGDELKAVNMDQENHLAYTVSLKKNKRTRRLRRQFNMLGRKVRSHLAGIKRR